MAVSIPLLLREAGARLVFDTVARDTWSTCGRVRGEAKVSRALYNEGDPVRAGGGADPGDGEVRGRIEVDEIESGSLDCVERKSKPTVLRKLDKILSRAEPTSRELLGRGRDNGSSTSTPLPAKLSSETFMTGR